MDICNKATEAVSLTTFSDPKILHKDVLKHSSLHVIGIYHIPIYVSLPRHKKLLLYVYGLLLTAPRANLHRILVFYSPSQNYSSKIVHDVRCATVVQDKTRAIVKMHPALIGYLYFDKT